MIPMRSLTLRELPTLLHALSSAHHRIEVGHRFLEGGTVKGPALGAYLEEGDLFHDNALNGVL